MRSEKLSESEEGKALRDRHLDYFVKLAEEGEVKLKSAERPAWTKRLETEQDNLRAALEWSLASDVAKGFRMVGALERFWLLRGYFTEGRDWSKRILAHSDKATPCAQDKSAPVPQDSLLYGSTTLHRTRLYSRRVSRCVKNW